MDPLGASKSFAVCLGVLVCAAGLFVRAAISLNPYSGEWVYIHVYDIAANYYCRVNLHVLHTCTCTCACACVILLCYYIVEGVTCRECGRYNFSFDIRMRGGAGIRHLVLRRRWI